MSRRPTVIYLKSGQSIGFTPDGVVGSTVAGRFFRTAAKGDDYVDVITIGDSNTGYKSSSATMYSYGWTGALHRTLGGFMGIPLYSSALIPGALDEGAGNDLVRGDTTGVNPLGTGIQCHWPSTSQSGETGAVGPLSRLEFKAGQSDANAVALKTNLGYTSASDSLAGQLPRFTGFPWDAAFLPAGLTYTSGSNKNLIRMNTYCPLIANASNTPLQYRCVYGKFASGSGQFRPSAWTPFTHQSAPAYVSTNGGSAGNWYGTTKFNFTGPTVTNGVAANYMIAGWDNFNNGSPAVGPFACLWHSVLRTNMSSGYAVNNYIYHGGSQAIHLYNRVNTNAGILDSYLKEIYARQTEVNGSGNTVVWINVGINGPDTNVTWPQNIGLTVDKIIERWTAVGNDPSKLAFVLSVTHPTSTVATWDSARAAVVTAANAYAAANVAKQVTVVDIAQYYTANELLADNVGGGTMYDAGGQAHLSSVVGERNGYDVVCASMLSALCSYV
jgi:hypothetical protein